jgi:hypothetical protein
MRDMTAGVSLRVGRAVEVRIGADGRVHSNGWPVWVSGQHPSPETNP